MDFEAKYEEHIICFYDILGYSGLMLSQDPDRQNDKAEVLNIQKRFASHPITNGYLNLKDLDNKISCEHLPAQSLLSDTFIKSYPADIEKEHADFNPLMAIFQQWEEEICRVTIHLIKMGVLIRGSITRGELYHYNNYCFGEGLAKAQSIEKQAKNLPVVLIDFDVFPVIKQYTFDKNEPPYINKQFFKHTLNEQDNDGKNLYYINPFGILYSQQFEALRNCSFDEYIDELDFINNKILENITRSKTYSNDSISKKWLNIDRLYKKTLSRLYRKTKERIPHLL